MTGDRQFRVAIDIGGTFTDFAALDVSSGQMWFEKVLTTPHDPAEAVFNGLHRLMTRVRVAPEAVQSVVHATTLASNAIIERKGATTGLLTTDGFEDVLEIGREKRFLAYDLHYRVPRPLVPRRWRLGVKERMDARANVVAPLDAAQLRDAAARLRRADIRSVAICFLHSYANGEHERQAAAVVKEQYPECFVSISSAVAPEIREYERTSTTVANAYLQPLIDGYLERLETGFAQLGRMPLYIMLSNGGVNVPDVIRDHPVRLLESGPAAGAIVSGVIARVLEWDKVVGFDMGGTTAKISTVDGFQPSMTTTSEVAREYRFQRGSGIPISIPTVDLIEIGAGGGSIASPSSLGLLQVGPESAGADPGPVCYGRGGTHPTVTDACLVLGYLNSEYFLGGEMKLDVAGARATVDQFVRGPLGLGSTEEAAMGIYALASEMMANAATVQLADAGKDPRSYALIAFGGAGPLFAVTLASKLGIARVAFPPGEGVGSAVGILYARRRFDFVRSVPSRLNQIDIPRVRAALGEMEQEGRAMLKQEGMADSDIECVFTADMRYVGQGYEVAVPVPPIDQIESSLKANFEREYERIFRVLNPRADLEVLSYRAWVAGPEPPLRFPDALASKASSAARKGHRDIVDPILRKSVRAVVYDREKLGTGERVTGPAVIEAPESTAVLPSGWQVEMARAGILVATSLR
jgi:N-methylhydantoinase A